MQVVDQRPTQFAGHDPAHCRPLVGPPSAGERAGIDPRTQRLCYFTPYATVPVDSVAQSPGLATLDVDQLWPQEVT